MFEVLEAVLDKYAKRIIKNAQDLLKSLGKNASGKLSESLDYKIDNKNDVTEVIFTGTDYLQYVEEGRRAGAKMPPQNKILKWMSIRGIKSKNPKSTAFLIGRSISINGIKKTHFMKKTIRKENNRLQKDIQNAAADFIRYDLIKSVQKRK